MSNDAQRTNLREHDMVALRRADDTHGLAKGRTGTVVFVHGDRDHCEVEFDLPGHAPIVVTLSVDQLERIWDAENRAYVCSQHSPGKQR